MIQERGSKRSYRGITRPRQANYTTGPLYLHTQKPNKGGLFFMAQIIKKTNKKGQVSYLIRVSEGYHSDGTQIKRSMTYTPEKGMTARQAEKEAQRQAILL